MKNNDYDKVYLLQKERKIRGFYVDLLCELLLLRYEYSYTDITRKDILSELPSLREFKSSEVDEIYNDSIKMLELKYGIKVLNDTTLKFINN